MLKRRTAALLAASFTATTVLGFGLLESGTATASAPSARTLAPVAAVAAHHAPRLITKSGVTMLKLDAGTAKVLAANGVKVTLASEARPGKSGITFPIRGGVVNPANLHGLITHEGGLTFTAGGKSLTVRDFTVRTTATTGTLTGYADQAGARLTILNLNLKHAKVAATKKTLAVSNVKATLNGQAAKALDAYFGTKLFTAGLTIGTVRVGANITTYLT